MEHASVNLWTEQSSDAELIAGVRSGESAAFGVLFERHGSAARRVAGMYSAVASDVDDIVSEAFARVLKALQQGDGPDMAFRAYLFTVVRRTGLDMIAKGKRTRPDEDMTTHDRAIGYEKPSDEPALDNFEQSVVADAFKSLPERWQVVLWYTEIEKKSPAEVAPLLGLSPNGVAALAYRAREALRQAYLHQHLATADNVECLAVSESLAAYIRGGLTKREHVKVDTHVKNCDRCTALIAELEDVNRGLRAVIAPLILGLLGVGALESNLPIGGFGAAQVGTGVGAAAGGAAGGAAAGTGAGVGAAAGLSGILARVLTGAQGGTTPAPAVSGFLASSFGSGSGVLTGVAATVGVAALAVASAGIIGTLSIHDEPGAQPDAPGTVDLFINAAPEVQTGDLPVYIPDPSAPGLTTSADQTPAGGQATTNTSDTGETSDTGAGGTGDTGAGGTGAGGDTDVIALGARVVATVPGGGAFALSALAPMLSMVLSNPSGQGSTPITVALDLPDGLEFATTLDKHGDPELLVADWTCDVAADRTAASCTSPSLPGSDARALTIPVVVITPPPANAVTTVTITTSIESLAPVAVPTTVNADPDPAAGGVDLALAAGALNYIELAAVSPEIPIRVHNAGTDDSLGVTVRVTPPAGVTFAGPGAGGSGYGRAGEGRLGNWMAFAAGSVALGAWTCNISPSLATCTIPTIAAGTTEWFSLDVTVAGTLGSDAVTTITFAEADGTSETHAVRTGLAPVERDGTLLFAAEGNLGTSVAGGMLMSCDQDAANCANALDGSGSSNNNSWEMEEVNTEGGTRNSASATMAVPPDASVLAAYLVWSANHGPADGFTGPTDTAAIRPPGETSYIPITADEVTEWTDPGGRVYYQARADVTDLLQQYGGGSWALADIAVTDGFTDTNPSYFAGFALTAVYEQASLPESSVAIYGGVDPVTKDDDAEYVFATDAQAKVDVSLVAWEGDKGLAGDSVNLDGEAMTPETTTSEGEISTGNPNNAFDSTATGSGVANSLGTDAKSFESETVEAGDHTLSVETDGDNLAVGLVVVQTTPTA